MGEYPLFVLLHGWGANREKLLPLGKALVKNGYKVLIPDLPGFGKAGDPSTPWDISDYASFVLKLAQKKLGDKKFFVFGHSFGGRVAIKMASLYPQDIAAIILCGSAGISRGLLIKRIGFQVLAKIGKMVFGENRKIRKLLYKLVHEHDYEKTQGVMAETFKKVINEDLKPILQKLDLPVLAVWGKDDKMTKYKDAKIIKKTVKNSQLVSFPGVGHKLPYEKPEELAKIISAWSDENVA